MVGRAFVHDLRNAQRIEVPVAEGDVEEAEELVMDLFEGLRARRFSALPEKQKCAYCDFGPMCPDRV
jgi:CRISPR/Cas system-associated exonuclease Cas4 (RecB family)